MDGITGIGGKVFQRAVKIQCNQIFLLQKLQNQAVFLDGAIQILQINGGGIVDFPGNWQEGDLGQLAQHFQFAFR